MIYKKIRMDFRDGKDRFYRLLLVRHDLDLLKLGCIMCTAIKAQFEHLFLFRNRNKEYVPEMFLIDRPVDNWLPMSRYKLSDLGESFVFEYDTGEGWDFSCKVYKKAVEKPGIQLAYLLDGRGQGIWEDNIYSLISYLDGRIDPNSNEENEEEGFHLPWNFENEKYGDFDTYDLEEEQEEFEDNITTDIELYLDRMHEDGFEMNASFNIEEYWEEEDEEDETDEEYNPRLQGAIIAAVEEQIASVDYIRETYKKLKKRYGEKEAKRKLAVVLTEEIHDCLKENKGSDPEAYRKKIEALI